LGFLVINVCNHGEHYEKPCMCHAEVLQRKDIGLPPNPKCEGPRLTDVCDYFLTKELASYLLTWRPPRPSATGIHATSLC